jgi:hypothetical protein
MAGGRGRLSHPNNTFRWHTRLTGVGAVAFAGGRLPLRARSILTPLGQQGDHHDVGFRRPVRAGAVCSGLSPEGILITRLIQVVSPYTFDPDDPALHDRDTTDGWAPVE